MAFLLVLDHLKSLWQKYWLELPLPHLLRQNQKAVIFYKCLILKGLGEFTVMPKNCGTLNQFSCMSKSRIEACRVFSVCKILCEIIFCEVAVSKTFLFHVSDALKLNVKEFGHYFKAEII